VIHTDFLQLFADEGLFGRDVFDLSVSNVELGNAFIYLRQFMSKYFNRVPACKKQIAEQNVIQTIVLYNNLFWTQVGVHKIVFVQFIGESNNFEGQVDCLYFRLFC
jgi:hypothetical protein